MKKTLAALVVAMLTPFAFADNTATQPVAAGSAVANSARTEGTSPPARTFAYANELKEVLAKATGATESGVVTLSAGCALETHEDGSYTDVSDPYHPKAYGPDNVFIDLAAFDDKNSPPMSVLRAKALLAEIASKASTPAAQGAAG